MKNKITGPVMFSREIYYTASLIQLTKALVSVTYAVAVMYSRNIPMAEKQSVCFQTKKDVVFFISKNYFIYLKIYFLSICY